MPSLRELQLAFLDALLANAPERALPLLLAPAGVAGEAAARAGFDVYADAMVATARQALEHGFPTVLALGGPEWFAGCVAEYARAEPSRSGDLYGRGERFPAFLAARLAGGPYAYFADVARLERAYQEVIVAAEAVALDPTALAAVPPERHAELAFLTHPAARVVESPWPILDVWRAHRRDAGTTSRLELAPEVHVDLGAGRQQVLVIRRTDHVELSSVTAGAAALFDLFAAGRTLGEAVDALGEDFLLAAALRELANHGALARFTLESAAQPKEWVVQDTAGQVAR